MSLDSDPDVDAAAARLSGRYTRPLAEYDYGDLIPVADFLNGCEDHNLIDYDGHGHPVLGGLVDVDTYVSPSKAASDLPADATHVLWFNR